VEVVTGDGSKGNVPDGSASKAMRWAIRAWTIKRSGSRSEPWEDDRNAAADGFAGLECRTLTQEEYGSFGGRLPLGEMRTLEIELGIAGRSGNCGARQAVFGRRER
jgi:hypothetical protein